MNKTKTTEKNARMRTGWVTFIALAVLTVVEYVISVYVQPSTPYLTATALIKAWLIISYFMHLAQVWRRETNHNDH